MDTKAQAAKAREAMLKEFPDATFSEIDRRSLGGNGNKADMFSGMGDILNMLARNDPEFAKVYLEEKRLLLEVMTKGDRGLHAEASKYIGV